MCSPRTRRRSNQVTGIRPAAVLIALCCLVQLDAAGGRIGWKPIKPEDFKITPSDIGDPDADAAVLFREGDLNDDDSDGTSLKVYVRIRIFTEQGRRYADVQLPYRADLGKITDVHARTVNQGGKEIEVESRDIFDKLIVTSEHSVWRSRTFSMPSASPGSIIEYRYRQTYPRGFRYFALDLQSDLFIKELQYKITPEPGSALQARWITFNARNPAQFTPSWDGSYNIKAQNIPPFRREPLMPPELAVKVWGWLYYSKETKTDPDQYWHEYGKEMSSRADIETRQNRAIRKVLDSITLTQDRPADKIRRIYAYVQNEIRNVGYVGREHDSGKLKQNLTADETIRRRYGTPREINRLFVAMLRAAGIDCRIAELTTRDEVFFHRSFPDSFQFNSEVSVVFDSDGRPTFYDPGTPHCPNQMLAWQKESVPALVYDKLDPRFIETPIADALLTGEERLLDVVPLPDGRVRVHQDVRISGHEALDLRNDLDILTEEQQRRRVIAGVKEVVPSANVDESSVAIVNAGEPADPVVLSCDFTAVGLATTERRILLRPALLCHKNEGLFTAPSRTNDVYFHHTWSEMDRVTLEIPEGYAPEQLPEDQTFDIGAARYQASFSRDGSKIVCQRKLVVNAIVFTPDQYVTVKAFFDRVHQADRTVVSLKR
jgi:transglutaminase-like putative cysteine protease